MNLNFNAREVTPDTGTPDPLPAGKYTMTITGAEPVASKSADAGEMLKIELTVDENVHPEFANRRAWDLLCINHSKTQTREIARKKLSAICHATGVLDLEQSEQLLGHGLVVKLKVQAADGTYEARNNVASYHKIGEEPKGEVAPQAAQQPAAATKSEPTPQAAPAENPKPAATGKRKQAWK